MYRLGKAAYSKGYPGFESLSLRHNIGYPISNGIDISELHDTVNVSCELVVCPD